MMRPPLRQITLALMLLTGSSALHAQHAVGAYHLSTPLFGPSLVTAPPVTAPLVTAPPVTAPLVTALPGAPAERIESGGWTALRVAKWSAAAVATGSAAYGLITNTRADDRYERIEQVCVEEPVRCEQLLPNGAYADEQLEAEYQEVRTLDGRSRNALIAAQIGVAASVVLFILDLRNSDGPENIPYEPRTFDILPARDGGMSLRFNFGS